MDFSDVWTNPAVIGALALALVFALRRLFESEDFQFPWWFPLIFTASLTIIIFVLAQVLDEASKSQITNVLNLVAAVFTATGYSVYTAKKGEPELPVSEMPEELAGSKTASFELSFPESEPEKPDPRRVWAPY